MSPDHHPNPFADPEVIDAVLRESRVIAVVGLSDNPDRDSHRVAAALQKAGYRIVPVNPNAAEILGEKCWPSVAAIPADIAVDCVDVFRKADAVPGIVDETLARGGVKALWLQLGVIAPEAAERAQAAGLKVVMDRCIKVEHMAFARRQH